MGGSFSASNKTHVGGGGAGNFHLKQNFMSSSVFIWAAGHISGNGPNAAVLIALTLHRHWPASSLTRSQGEIQQTLFDLVCPRTATVQGTFSKRREELSWKDIT